MSDYKTIIYEQGLITKIIHNEPETGNTFNETFQEEYVDALKRFEWDKESSIALITARGKDFCTGIDLSRYIGNHKEAEKFSHYTEVDWRYEYEKLTSIFLSIWDCRKTLVCAAQGACLDIGEDFLLAHDVIIMAEDAYIGAPMMRLSKAGFGLLGNFVGYRIAMEHYLTGWNMSSSELHRHHVINRVVPTEKLETAGEKYAKIISFMPKEGLKITKNSIKFSINRRGARESIIYNTGMNIDGQMASKYQGPQIEFYKALAEKGVEAALQLRDSPYELYGYDRQRVTEI